LLTLLKKKDCYLQSGAGPLICVKSARDSSGKDTRNQVKARPLKEGFVVSVKVAGGALLPWRSGSIWAGAGICEIIDLVLAEEYSAMGQQLHLKLPAQPKSKTGPCAGLGCSRRVCRFFWRVLVTKVGLIDGPTPPSVRPDPGSRTTLAEINACSIPPRWLPERRASHFLGSQASIFVILCTKVPDPWENTRSHRWFGDSF